MALERPQWKNNFRNSAGFLWLQNTNETIFNITDGPGMIKGGGFSIENILSATSAYRIKIIIDTITIFDQAWDVAIAASVIAANAPWVVVGPASNLDFDFISNVQLGFTSSFEIECRNNGADDTVDITSWIDYQIGA